MVTTRPAKSSDFFSWLDLFAAYGEFSGSAVTDERALIVWQWIENGDHDVHAVVAEDSEGALVGFAHYRAFAHPLRATTGIAIDDVFVTEASRGEGVAAGLIDYVTEHARTSGAKLLRLTTSPNNDVAQVLYESVAERSDIITYELTL